MNLVDVLSASKADFGVALRDLELDEQEVVAVFYQDVDFAATTRLKWGHHLYALEGRQESGEYFVEICTYS